MYFITPSDPNIFLIGVNETQLYGIGEKDEKLCIFQRSMFDIGNWQEYFMINIKPVKCDGCKNGIHVATRIFGDVDIKLTGVKKLIWIAARENQYTRVFSIDIVTKKLTRYKMLEEIYPEFALIDLNLCCKCVAPVILKASAVTNFVSLVIAPRQCESEAEIYRIHVSINKSNHCLLWDKSESFFIHPDSSSNITTNFDGDVLSLIGEPEEDGRIDVIRLDSEDEHIPEHLFLYDDNMNSIWHEASFCTTEDFCLTRRKDGDNSFLQLWLVEFSVANAFYNFNPIDQCIIDAKFPSLDSTQFFVSYQFVENEYESKRSCIINFPEIKLSALISSVTFQSSDGKSIVTIPFRPLSLSESAYLSLARIPRPPQISSLPFAIHYRNLFHQNESEKEEVQNDEWMSINFIKKCIGWSKILPLTKEPNFSK